jgi:nitrogen fixation/metabolism regulation signal transduction histidine kinase
MSQTSLFESKNSSLRQRILASVGAMVLLSLLSSSLNLYRMTEVTRLIEAMNHVSVPLGRMFTQMQSDAEAFQRELERSLGQSHWKDSHWKPRPAPQWIAEVLANELVRVKELIRTDSEWASLEERVHWSEWVNQISQELETLELEGAKLYLALEQKNEAAALEIYPKWAGSVDEWKRHLQWGASEYEHSLRQNFSVAENRVVEIRTGLEVILVIVVLLSLLFLWLGERALRPLAELTGLAREITRRGLRKEDKSLLPEIPISRSDEVSQLAREFHHMATALLEREKTVELQKSRLQEQNRLMGEIGALNQNILNSIESVLIVTDFAGRVTQCNPQALSWLGGQETTILGSALTSWPALETLLKQSAGGEDWLGRLQKAPETWKLGPLHVHQRVYGGHLMPLREEMGKAHGTMIGAIIVLDDLTDEVDLQDRLRRAENLVAVGRMSAQVAHEVRNPLHSIGLEAEMAAEMASRLGDPALKLSLTSILNSVDRLENITENYLKLSRLSTGRKSITDMGDLLESVLATYAPVCEEQGVQVEWTLQPQMSLKVWADRDLMEQVLGNLFRNSLQALEDWTPSDGSRPKVAWSLGGCHASPESHESHESSEAQDLIWLRIQDNGPGIPAEIREKLFTPFVTTRAQGTGLGLSFIKKVLEDHGGSVAEARDQDALLGGACFDLKIPKMPLSVEVFESQTRREMAHV